MSVKNMYRKFVVSASDYTPDAPHLRADCYAVTQAQKLGLPMCLKALGRQEVRRTDTLGQPITLTIREVFVDDQGNELGLFKKIDPKLGEVEYFDVDVENPTAHNFTVQNRGYVLVRDGDRPRAAQMFEPYQREKSVKWELRPTNAKESQAKAFSDANQLEQRAAAIRAAAIRNKQISEHSALEHVSDDSEYSALA